MFLVLLLVIFACMDNLNNFRRQDGWRQGNFKGEIEKREGGETFSLNGDNGVYLFLLTVENRV